jgi:tetratricopeptide (TPR) repeat protein
VGSALATCPSLRPARAYQREEAGQFYECGENDASLGAIVVYREALKEFTRKRAPLQWATTQYNLGNVLLSLGERDGRTAKLEEAIAAFREALKELTREAVPYQHDIAQKYFERANVLLTQQRKAAQ